MVILQLLFSCNCTLLNLVLVTCNIGVANFTSLVTVILQVQLNLLNVSAEHPRVVQECRERQKSIAASRKTSNVTIQLIFSQLYFFHDENYSLES